MSGVCPVPFSVSQTDYSTSSTVTIVAPDPQFNGCGSGVTVTSTGPGSGTTETCCSVPGPPGPVGAPGTLTIQKDGVTVVGTAAVLNFTGSNTLVTSPSGSTANVSTGVVLQLDGTEVVAQAQTINFNSLAFTLTDNSPIGTVGLTGIGNMTYVGVWNESTTYNLNEVVTYHGSDYISIISSNTGNKPTIEGAYEDAATTWQLLSSGESPDIMTSVSDWFNGTVDWLKNIKNWGIKDFVKLLTTGAGIYLTGSTVLSLFSHSGSGDGQASSKYSGSDTASSSFTGPTLYDAIESIFIECGVTSYDIDSSLSSIYVNFGVGQVSSGETLLRMLCDAYFLDVFDNGQTMKVVTRGTTSVRTLTQWDLGFVNEGSAPGVPYAAKRMQGMDLPQKIRVKYTSATNGYNEAIQESSLFSFPEGQVIEFTVPMVLTDEYAKIISERMLVDAHTERTSLTVDASYFQCELEPSDVITLDTDKYYGDVRIVEVSEQEDGRLSFSLVEVTSYTQSDDEIAVIPPYTDTVPEIGYSGGLIIEPTQLSDGQSTRLLVAPHGYGLSGWPGCDIYTSRDGVSYEYWTNATREATWGKVATAISSPSNWNVFDNTSTISVELKTGTLSSATELQVLNGTNWAMIGQEIIGFTTATFVSGTTYTLSGLLRGRRGTDANMGSHAANELFILLDSTLIEFPYDISEKSQTFHFKFVTVGSDLSKADDYTAQPSTYSVRPWKITNLAATRNLSTNDWSISWLGRNQFQGEMVDSTTVINPDQFGGFILQVYNGATPVRTVTQSTTDYVYTSAMQVTDFGSNQSTISILVSQLDLRVGPGFATEQTF